MAEVVPISSSAQLLLLPWLAGWPPPPDRTGLATGLHAGSCAGIAWSLKDELRGLDRRTALLLACSTLPAAVAGLSWADRVEQRLGRPGPTAAVLALAGAALWSADQRPTGAALAGPQVAAAALAQVLALVPGVSRSGATLTALRAARVSGPEAVRFSMLMSLPITGGAAALALVRAGRPAPGVAIGAPVAALTGATAARLALRRGDRMLAAAALYRLGLAAAVAVRLARQRRTRA